MKRGAANPWQTIPPPVRRIGYFWSAFFLVSVPWTLGVMWWGSAQAHPQMRFAAMLLAVLPLLPTLIALVVASVRIRRLWRVLDATGGVCCARCLYALRDEQHRGICPECGKSFDIERDRQTWMALGWSIAERPSAGEASTNA